MARPAPGVDRTIALITFLSRHPGRPFSLSDLARRLDLNKATAHAMLSALTESGWLLRNPSDKTYRLGPQMITIGDAAAGDERHGIELARPRMRRLGDELGAQLVGGIVMGEHVVTVAVEGPITAGVELITRPGHQVPFVPPFGTVHVAWAEPEDVERWLQRATHDPADANDLDVHRRTLDLVRRRGFSLAVAHERLIDPRASLRTLASHSDADSPEPLGIEIDSLLNDMAPASSYHLATISAPVFDATGRVILSITLTSFPEGGATERIADLASKLTDLASSVTVDIGGRPPSGAAS